VVQAVRNFFESRGYLEVETPVRVAAPAPEAHIQPLPSAGAYLQTSPELFMKRLLAAGYDKIFQICKCFRNAERGRRHLPELTLLEWYEAGQDYHYLMAQCRQLIQDVAHQLGQFPTLEYGDQFIELKGDWDFVYVSEAYKRYAGVSMNQALADGCFDELMAERIEPQLGLQRPLFLHDYPASCGSLARLKQNDPTVAERFELYIAGLELCNGFSELTDPGEQRMRFEQELARRRHAGETATPMPEAFLTALADMPPAAGNALGIDRLVMLLTNADCIDDVVGFVPEEQ
jgi:lysyl-tRNA synthetase class 2